MKTIKKILPISFAIALVALTSACTTYTVVSDSNPTRWKDGRGLNETANNNAKFSAAIDSNTNEVITFLVELQSLAH